MSPLAQDAIQARIDALKEAQDEARREKKRVTERERQRRIRAARKAEQAEREGLGHGNESGSKRTPRSESGGNRQSGRIVEGRSVIPRNGGDAGDAAQRYQREYPRNAGDAQYPESTGVRPLADFDNSERAGREDDGTVVVRNLGADQSRAPTRNVAARLGNTVRARATELLDSGVERLANLGKDEPRSQQNGRRRKDAPDADEDLQERHHWYEFSPVSQVANFVGELGEEYARPFSDEEVKDKESDVADKLQFWAEQADEFLTISNAQEAVSTIWRLDDEDAHILARVWLKRAKKDKRAAALLRATLEGSDYLAATMILGSRGWNTSFWYPSHGGFNLREWRTRQDNEHAVPRPLRAEAGPS